MLAERWSLTSTTPGRMDQTDRFFSSLANVRATEFIPALTAL